MDSWRTENGVTVTEAVHGRCNCYVVAGRSGSLVVDAAGTGAWRSLRRALDAATPSHGAPALLVLTHTHFDHATNAARLVREYGLRIAVHENERALLASGDSPMPRGTILPTRLLERWFGEQVRGWVSYPGVSDAESITGPTDLSSRGFQAELLPTPGHSAGSLSVIVDHEIALVGDAAFGVLPGGAFPPFADDPAELVRSWRLLLDSGARLFLPGHGRPIGRDTLERAYLARR